MDHTSQADADSTHTGKAPRLKMGWDEPLPLKGVG